MNKSTGIEIINGAAAGLERGQFADRGSEDAGVEIDVRGGGGGRHERHVVERGEEDAAIERVEMHEALELEIGCGCGFSAVARRKRMEEIFCAASETRDAPGEACLSDGGRDSIGEPLGERDHVLEGCWSEHVLERGAHGGERKRVAGKRAADAARVAIFELDAVSDLLGDFGAATVRSRGQAAGDGFADDEEIGLEAVLASVAARAGADRVRLVE